MICLNTFKVCWLFLLFIVLLLFFFMNLINILRQKGKNCQLEFWKKKNQTQKQKHVTLIQVMNDRYWLRRNIYVCKDSGRTNKQTFNKTTWDTKLNLICIVCMTLYAEVVRQHEHYCHTTSSACSLTSAQSEVGGRFLLATAVWQLMFIARCDLF